MRRNGRQTQARCDEAATSPKSVSPSVAPREANAVLANERDRAARDWCTWEDAHVSLSPGHRPSPQYEDPAFRLQFARLVTHYWRSAAFLEEDQLIRDAAILNGIPGVLIHGRFDVSSPLETAWELSKRWASSDLHVLDDAGHGNDQSFPLAVTGALSRLAAR